MARRKKQGGFEDLIELAAMLPWWLGLSLAVVSYLLLHSVATTEIVTPSNIKDMGGFAGKQLWKTLALIGQYLLPIAFSVGAAVSAFKRQKREQLHEKVAAAAQPQALLDMSWEEFEILVGEAFLRRGFAVQETGGGGADGGVDLVLTQGKDKYFVQCKQWRAYKVGVATVRELYGVMAANGGAGGFLVTSGVFTEDAKDFASGRNINLIDGPQLTVMIAENPTKTRSMPLRANRSQSSIAACPACPTCGGEMVKRTAQKGSNAGHEFWGCAAFPKCRGIQSI